MSYWGSLNAPQASALFGGATSANYAVSGYVDPTLLGLLLLGGLAGGLAGNVISRGLVPHQLLARRLFALMILAVAVFVAWQAGSALLLEAR